VAAPGGLAHIGAIKVLEEHGIPIDLIAGTSIGAMIGGLYAAGLSVKKLEEIALSSDWRTVLNVFLEPPLKQGLIKGDKTRAFNPRTLPQRARPSVITIGDRRPAGCDAKLRSV